MIRVFHFATAVSPDPAVDAWFDARPGELGAIARGWFAHMRLCGTDVRELLHDGHPTACVGGAAFGYVNVFTHHTNVGFFIGPELPDHAGILRGTGKYMRHVKLRPGVPVDLFAVGALIAASYRLMGAEVRARQEGIGEVP